LYHNELTQVFVPSL